MFFNHEQNRLEKLQNNRALFSSSILEFLYDKLGFDAIGKEAYEALAQSNKPIVVSDVYKYADSEKFQFISSYFIEHNVHSFIMIPVVKDNQLLAILEMSSGIKGAFNSLKVKSWTLLLLSCYFLSVGSIMNGKQNWMLSFSRNILPFT